MAESAAATGAPTPKLDAIRALTREGYILIPLRGKIPAIKAWENAAPGVYGEEQLKDKNYGVALKASDLVLDVDPRNFGYILSDGRVISRREYEAAPTQYPGAVRDAKALTRLCALVPGLEAVIAASFVVRTGGGGLHIYLYKPADLVIRQGLPDFPGIEFKTAGRQVVGPGSIHPDTQKTYDVIRNSPSSVGEAPARLLELLAAPAARPSDNELGTEGYVDDDATRTRYEAYLLTAPPAIEGKSGDNETFKVACAGHDLGLPPKTTWELMLLSWNARCSPPWTPDELKVKVINAYKFAKGKLGNKHPSAAGFEKLAAAEAPTPEKESDDIAWNMSGGRVTKSLYNLMNYIKWKQGGLHRVFGYNLFTGQVEFTRSAPWHKGRPPVSTLVQDDDLKLLRAYLVTEHDFEAGINDIENAVTAVAHRYPFHPVREYLEGLKWDGVSRLDFWLSNFCGAEDNEYTRAVGRKVLCAAVARVFKPGIKFDHVLVLEGAQGIGKSSVVKILGGQWFGDFTIDPHNKDTVQLMQGKWICEIAELVFKGQAEENAVKAFITRTVDKVRLAYGRYATEFLRQSIFIGSINPTADNTFLKDETGGRRWWPVSCKPRTPNGKVDFKGLKDARDQLFAEALERVRTVGEDLSMSTAELEDAAREVVNARTVQHPWAERVGQWIDSRADAPAFITNREVWVDCLGGLDKEFDQRKARTIASAMRSLGWEADVQRVGEHHRPTRGYCRVGSKPEKKEETKKSLDSFASLY